MKILAIGILGAVVLASAAYADVPFPNLATKTPPIFVKDVVATSTFADKNDAYAAPLALAYQLRAGATKKAAPVLWSAWCEGKADEGINETLTIHLAEPTKLDGVKIAPGVWRTDALFAANNQPTSLEVSLDGKPQTLAVTGKQWVTAKVTGKVSTIAIKILAVKKGKMNDTCIAAIDLVRGKTSRSEFAIGLDAKAFAAIVPNVRDMQKVFTSTDRKGLDGWLAFPLSVFDVTGTVTGMGDGATVVTKSMAEVTAACKSFDDRRAKDQDDWVDPKGCPFGADEDDRPANWTIDSRGGVSIDWPSHHEAGTQWNLAWDGAKWRLRSIAGNYFEMPGMDGE